MTKRIDFQERRVIEDLLNHGTEIKDIADILHRSKSAISAEIKASGGIRKYIAEQAQKLSDERALKGNKDKNTPLQHLTNRVTQIEITLNKLINSLELNHK